MDAISISAASGMRSRMESLDLLANNIANANTSGFKTDHEFYNLYVSPEALDSTQPLPATLPVVERRWTDFSQGTLTSTGNSLDFALSGSGFFVVDGKTGPVYTRNGNFRLSSSGEVQTQDGFPVRKVGGGAIKGDPAKAFAVSTDGTVSQEGQTIGRVELAAFDHPETLEKMGASYFRLSNVKEIVRAAQSQIHQGQLESANGAPAENAVRLVSIMRQFEMLQRALSIGTDMNRKSIDEVARATS
jgi:flagellar basal-body rod protein FlgF